MSKYEILQEIINSSSSIVVFTGAGISVPSGIPDFRSANGLYSQRDKSTFSPEEIISHSFFYSHPDIFYDFYKSKMVYPNAKPNIAHTYFANLEKKGKNVTIVTQNIDGLHQQAGSKRVYELHGSIHRNYCDECGASYSLSEIMNSELKIPFCKKCGAIIKPDVVLYEEPLDDSVINLAISAIMTCDTLIVIGTSLTVYPAAGFIRYFRGRNLVVINKTPLSSNVNCDLEINEDCEKVFQQIN